MRRDLCDLVMRLVEPFLLNGEMLGIEMPVVCNREVFLSPSISGYRSFWGTSSGWKGIGVLHGVYRRQV